MRRSVKRVVGADARELASALSKAISEHRASHGLLAPVEVVADTRALRTWLQLELAALGGGCANVTFRSPASLLAPAFRPAAVAALFDLLGDPLVLSSPANAALRSYVHREAHPERRALRRYELSAALADTFSLYRAHAPELLARWRAGEASASEAWQADLWLRLMARLQAPPVAPLAAGWARFVFDLALPGADVLEVLAASPAPLVVFQRSTVGLVEDDPWLHHGALRARGRHRWGSAVSFVEDAAPGPFDAPFPDVSLLGASSDRRLCEGVVAQAWRWFRDDALAPPLRFHEVAFVVPEARQDTLVPLLDEVMREAHEMPRVLWSQPPTARQGVLRLTRALLELPTTPLRRADVLAVLRHPGLAGASERVLSEDWADWLDSVGIFHGLDAAALGDTYLAGQMAVHWDQGLTRLALGAFMGGERSGPPGVVELPDGTRYVSEERTQSAQEGLGTLVTLTRSLLADARGLADACLTVPHWHALLVSYVTTYVQPDGDGDERALGAVLRALAGLLDRPFVETLPYTVVQRLALEALEGLSLDVGGHLAQGVVIGTPAALVGVPFRRVAFLGLEEGSFPALPGRSELDLRDAGDLERTDGRRRDTCDFFTLVHDTREHVCLAYLAFDPISGEARAPSSLIDDLRARHPRAQPPPAPVLLAAHRFEDLASGELGAAVAWAFPEARAEGAVAGLGAAWQARAGVEPALSDVEEGWRAFVGATLPTPATAAMESTLELRLDHLSLFLRCPAQGFARAVLGLRGDDDARDALIDEPFAHSALDEAVVFKEVLYRLVSEVPGAALASPAGSAKAIEALYDEVTRRRAGAGMAPVGYFARLQRRKDLEALVSASAALVADDARGPQPPGARLRWGPSASSAVGVLASRPPLALEVSIAGGARRVRLSGETGVLFADGAREVRFQRSAKTSVSGPWRAAIRWRELLTGWVSHLALQATGVRARRRSQVATPEGVAFETTFDDLDPAQAKQELGRIVETLMARRVGYRAPAVAFFADRAGLGPSVPWAQRIARFRELCDKVYLGQKAVERAHFAGLREIDALPEPGQAAFEAQFERLSFFLDRETPAVEQAAPTRAAGKRKKS